MLASIESAAALIHEGAQLIPTSIDRRWREQARIQCHRTSRLSIAPLSRLLVWSGPKGKRSVTNAKTREVILHL